jgi:hypothetical protein
MATIRAEVEDNAGGLTIIWEGEQFGIRPCLKAFADAMSQWQDEENQDAIDWGRIKLTITRDTFKGGDKR